MGEFRIALGAGTIVVVALAIAGLFPLATIAGSLLVPLLTLLYVYDVDVYEDEPRRVLALTAGWAVLAGAAVGALSAGIGVGGADLVVRGGGTGVALRGVVWPLFGLLLMLAGPLVLLPYRRFNDVLDGATFGVTSAAAFVAAQALWQAHSLFDSGLRPVGELAPWLVRLLTLALAAPLLAMALAGGVCAAFWLRFRAPVRDRTAIGALGRPLVALVAAAASAVAGACAQVVLPGGWALAVLIVLALAASSWLRRAIHVGLLEEAAETPVGPVMRCANCGESTPRGAFCAKCEIAIAALPKAERAWRRPLILLAAASTVLLGGLAAVAGAVFSAGPKPICPTTGSCGKPPQLAKPLVTQRVWRSTSIGYRLEYDPKRWVLFAEDGDGLSLRSRLGDLALSLTAVPAAESRPRQLLDRELDVLGGGVLGLAPDDDPAHRLLGPNVGFHDGPGGAYAGALDSPQGIGAPVGALVMSAGDRRVTVVASTVTTEMSDPERRQLLQEADSVLNTIRFPSEAR